MQQSTVDCENSSDFPFETVFKLRGFIRIDGPRQVTVQTQATLMERTIAAVKAAMNVPFDEAGEVEAFIAQDEEAEE